VVECAALSSNPSSDKEKTVKNLPMSTHQLYLISVHYAEAVLFISTIPFIFTDFIKLIKYYVKQSEE
jgi:hypothetical protein